ncbi:MAG: hypothetical protein A3F41_01085 [Coxiella sp. RIFCSPHIGHO2_12_FULL_44_14]|nr:MAG: hypothetical protein A3F41_01085 [Coxiella sp. RIFCSPHIGHO2_12_FULL_44_14]
MLLNRSITSQISQGLERGKSILLLGPRQTGKTTLIKSLPHDRYLNLMDSALRRHYEQSPSHLLGEIKALNQSLHKPPCVIIDEVQRCPELMDVVQLLIDEKIAQFMITGSSARKLRRHSKINLLPGRVIALTLAPLLLAELPYPVSLEDQFNYGTLPGIVLLKNNEDKNTDLMSYTSVYLEEEVRAEALVRDVGHFSRFLQLSAAESGSITHFNRLSEHIGISHTTIKEYYQILEDCMIAIRIDPLIHGVRKRLVKSSRYIYFDLGVRRACAKENIVFDEKTLGHLFEQWVTLITVYWQRYFASMQTLRFWRDANGPEVDLIIQSDHEWLPIEVKWTAHPTAKDIRHLQLFMREYPEARRAVVVCRAPFRREIEKNILAIPWQEWPKFLEENILK